MKKCINSVLFFLMLITVAEAYSQGSSATEIEISNRSGFLPNATIGSNILSRGSFVEQQIILPKNVIQFSGGLGADYFLLKRFGVFTNFNFNKRSFYYLNLAKASASYIDIPFGIAFNPLKNWFEKSRETMRMGGYVALPTTDFEFDEESSLKLFGVRESNIPFLISKAFVGIYLETELLLPIAKNLNSGISLWYKLPLGSSSKKEYSRFTELGIGLKFGFF